MENVATLAGAAKDYDGVFGFVSLLLLVLTALGAGAFGWVQLQKAGKQKIAEARLAWDAQYKAAAIELDQVMMELERLMQPGTRSLYIRRFRLQMQARRLATTILLMVNPLGGKAASAEYKMERRLCTRLARVGVAVDFDYVTTHRAVLKENWTAAKNELWRKKVNHVLK